MSDAGGDCVPGSFTVTIFTSSGRRLRASAVHPKVRLAGDCALGGRYAAGVDAGASVLNRQMHFQPFFLHSGPTGPCGSAGKIIERYQLDQRSR